MPSPAILPRLLVALRRAPASRSAPSGRADLLPGARAAAGLAVPGVAASTSSCCTRSPFTLLGRRFDLALAQKHRRHHAEPRRTSRSSSSRSPPTCYSLPGIGAALVGGDAEPRARAHRRHAATSRLGLRYEWVHFLIHTRYRPRTWWFRRLWRNHRLHHFRNERHWYGVTMLAADRVLGTAGDEQSVPASPTRADAQRPSNAARGARARRRGPRAGRRSRSRAPARGPPGRAARRASRAGERASERLRRRAPRAARSRRCSRASASASSRSASRGNGAVHEADALGLGAVEDAAGVEQLGRVGRADEARQRPGGAPCPGGCRAASKLRPSFASRAAMPQVAAERDAAAGADRRAVDRGEGRAAAARARVRKSR